MSKRGSSSSDLKRRPIEAEDLLRLVGVGDPQVTPDGRQLVFVRSVVTDRQKPESSLWIAATDGSSPPRALTHGPKDSMPRLAPDGRRVAFLRGADGKATQIAMLELGGGEARPMTNMPEGAFRTVAWSPDGTRLAVAFRQTEEAWTIDAKKSREREGQSDPPRIINDRWNRLDGDGWFGAARHALYLIDASSGVTSGTATKLYDGDTLGDFDCAWSPDGGRLAITTNRVKDALLKPWKSELAILDAKRGTLTTIEGLPIGPKLGVTWSPDGSRLAWAGRKGRDSAYSTENLELWSMSAPGSRVNSAKNKKRKNTPNGHARSLTHATDLCLLSPTLSDSSEVAFRPTILWKDEGTVLARVGWHGGGHLVAISLDAAAPKFLTKGFAEHVIGNASSDGTRIAALRSDPTTPAEAGTLELTKTGASWKPVTNFNVELKERLDLAAPSEHWVSADDGHRTQVWVIRPPKSAPRAARSRGSRRPAVLEIHGGPHTQYGACFFHEFQLLAAQGYVVVFPNPRGSKGYGRDHCDPIRGAWGDKDWLDVQAVTRFMQSLKDVDPKRIGIMGGSYGGYMTNWAIGHSKAYRAAITDRCVANLLSFGGNSDYPLVPGEYWPGTNYDNPEPLWKSSPIAYFKGVTTPTLIIHSEGDLRCNIEQGEQVHTALALQGVPTRFVRYPLSTSHGMSRSGPPDMKLHRLREIVAWWKKWL